MQNALRHSSAKSPVSAWFLSIFALVAFLFPETSKSNNTSKNILVINPKYLPSGAIATETYLNASLKSLAQVENYRHEEQILREDIQQQGSDGESTEDKSFSPSDDVIADDYRLVGRPMITETNHSRRLIVYNPDERVIPAEKQYPESTVGKIVFKKGDGHYYSCTATLVDREHILTNAHCLFDTKKNAENKDVPDEISDSWKKTFRFYPYYREGRSPDYAGWKSLVFSATYQEGQKGFSGHDWAIIRLDKAFGDAFGWMRLLDKKYEDYRGATPTQINLCGYSGDHYTETPGAHYGCHTRNLILYSFGIRLTHDCDSTKGSSGSALYRINEEGESSGLAEIHAIHHAHVTWNGQVSQYREKYSISDANLACETHGAYVALIQSRSSDLEPAGVYRLSGWNRVSVQKPSVPGSGPNGTGGNFTRVGGGGNGKRWYDSLVTSLPYIGIGVGAGAFLGSALYLINRCVSKQLAVKKQATVDSPV